MSNFNMIAADVRAAPHDHFTITLHWLSALLVVNSHWPRPEASLPVERRCADLIFVHISLGV
ncbi:hypothetical protein PY650_01415 [Rhizobium calliandrae]|uniref:AraC family transcriptional regulator n=1 Tax=Rhizobium calliandrae TaxID=1312182 RepID=A0ABT7K763_9HYPH|nr:hypothetical protein [Rhizobium calliandrae]MDL2404336.1 hypothetical protein [Rhizobium calliandrae]